MEYNYMFMIKKPNVVAADPRNTESRLPGI